MRGAGIVVGSFTHRWPLDYEFATHTVRGGDPFVAANAYRLQAIAWVLLALQLLSLVIGGIGKAISTPRSPASPRCRLFP